MFRSCLWGRRASQHSSRYPAVPSSNNTTTKGTAGRLHHGHRPDGDRENSTGEKQSEVKAPEATATHELRETACRGRRAHRRKSRTVILSKCDRLCLSPKY